MGQEDVDAQTSGIFSLVVVQAVLLFRFEMWVISPHIWRTRGGFQHWEISRLTRRNPRLQVDRSWPYPPMTMLIAEAGLEEVVTYITHRQNTVTHFIATRNIMDLCLAAERPPGAQVSQRW